MKNSKIEILTLGRAPEITAASIGANLLLEKILEENKGCLYYSYSVGYSDKPIEDFISIFEKWKGIKFQERIFSPADEGHASLVYSFDHGMADITYAHLGQISFSIYSSNEEFVKEATKEIDSLLSEQTKKGFIFAIMRNQSVLQLTRIGFAGTPLERGNYSKKVLSDYDFVIKDLKSATPSGRIVILDGAPGTGKTFLTRSILMDVPDAMFVLVPPSMVSSLGGPDLLPLLLQNKESYQMKGPTILILEDADDCLVPRGGDNMSSISSILNLGDGIFGSLFDIRIIATTNAKKSEMDDAIMRPGRLSKQIEVLPFNYEEANAIFKRLVPSKELPRPAIEEVSSGFKPSSSKKSTWTLAEIYRSARENGWEPPPNVDKKKVKNKFPTGDYDFDDY